MASIHCGTQEIEGRNVEESHSRSGCIETIESSQYREIHGNLPKYICCHGVDGTWKSP